MTRMSSFLLIILVSFIIVSFYRRTHQLPKKDQPSASNTPAKIPEKSRAVQGKIQVVFALDATGSMSGLIGAAKEKIWSIAGSLAQANPAPKIEMGLLF